MKRIILSLGMLLMLAQNGFAKTDAEYDKIISEQKTEVWKQIWRCNKETFNHENYGNVDVCLKAIQLEKEAGFKEKDIRLTYLNIGVIYAVAKKDYVKAYRYWMKAAKLGNTNAQENLDILCREHSWVCK